MGWVKWVLWAMNQIVERRLRPTVWAFPEGCCKAAQQMFAGGDAAASARISPSCLTWHLVVFDGLVLEGHGLNQQAFVEVFVGLVGAVVAWVRGEA